MKTIVWCTALASLVWAGGVRAQETIPEGWQVRFDHAGADPSQLEFVTMEPGWHVTTGPAGILYRPSQSANGNFTARATIDLFDPGRRMREAFGIFVGGRDLQSADQAYLYFLIRNDGSFLVKRRAGSGTETLEPWTKHEAIVVWDGTEQSAKNVLSVEVGTDRVRFLINGAEAASLRRDALTTDGIVGLRVNHSLNLHVSELVVVSD